MGTGKTVAGLTALDLLFLSGDETKPALVTAPLRVAINTWPDEQKKWSHLSGLDVLPIVGDAKTRSRQMGQALFHSLMSSNVGVYTINYENIPWLIETLKTMGMKWPFGTVYADESTKLKGFRLNQGRRRARALAQVAHSECSRWVNFTGTPAPNGLVDLWGQSWYIDAGQRLGRTFNAFKERWFQRDFDGHSLNPLHFAEKEITEKLRDVCVSINAADYFDIKQPIVNKIYVELPVKARALYRDMEREMFMQIEEFGVEAFNAASRTTKCSQLANGAAYVGEDAEEWREVHDEKLQAMEDIIEEAAGMPVLVAYHFRSDLDRLRSAFPKGRVLDADPGTIRDWNAGRVAILFAHPASAGHGLNLQDGGNIVAFFGVDWNLELHDQIIERIGPVRQLQAGHNRPVFIHYILARDTIDEQKMERLATKRSVQSLLLEAMKRKAA
jgi:SNF2 family DNA or RNA helicase